MLKFLTRLFILFSQSAQSEIINYVIPSQQDLGTISVPDIQTVTKV